MTFAVVHCSAMPCPLPSIPAAPVGRADELTPGAGAPPTGTSAARTDVNVSISGPSGDVLPARCRVGNRDGG